MFKKKSTLTFLALGSFTGLIAAGCGIENEPGYRSVEQEVAGECTTTSQCKLIYGGEANDCKNSLGGVCYCGSTPCSDSTSPPAPSGITIPDRIEAEEFVDYTDTTAAHYGDCGSGPVDMQVTTDPSGGACNVGWTAAGETLSYLVNSTGGTFDIDLRVASQAGGKNVSVLVDGAVVGSVTAPGTGWQSWATKTIDGVNLSPGDHTIVLRFDTGEVNLNWFEVKSAATTPPTTGSCEIKGVLRKWHRVELLCDGPSLGENQDATFVNQRMNVTFSNGSTTLKVPGHFAADGNAANTGSTNGSKWRAYLMPPKTGNWNYSVSFRQGTNVAVDTAANAGNAVSGIDGKSGSFSVQATNKSGRDMRAHGLLAHDANDRYLRFAETGVPFVEGGVDSPENLFGYSDFDNTTKESNVGSCKGILHSFSTHASDWNSGDPTWKNGKGKSLIGAVNYLASTGVNSIYLVPMSVNGDGCDAHPWTDYYGNRKRFDVSKLDQWETVFSHMTEKGFMIHFVTQETENDQLLNGGALGLERKLYYREIVSRFGHHPALQWNLGEENTNTSAQQKSFADYLKAIDPYDHAVFMHTYPGDHDHYDALLGHGTFDGPTLQYGNIPQSGNGGLYGETVSWNQQSQQAGRSWVVTATEASGGQAPTPNTNVTKTQRVYWMYANVMAGGGGFEWYLKNNGAGHAYDLAVENQREFDNHWKQSGHLVSFFNGFFPGEGYDLEDLTPGNSLTSSGSDWVLADPGSAYLVFLRDGGSTNITLSGGGQYRVTWFNPRTGQMVERSNLPGSGSQGLGNPPNQTSEDWLVFVRR